MGQGVVIGDCRTAGFARFAVKPAVSNESVHTVIVRWNAGGREAVLDEMHGSGDEMHLPLQPVPHIRHEAGAPRAEVRPIAKVCGIEEGGKTEMKAFLSCERIFRAEFNSDCVEFSCGNGAVGGGFGLRKAVSRAVFGFYEAEREGRARKHGKMCLRPLAERVFEKERAVDGHKVRPDVAAGIGVGKPSVVILLRKLKPANIKQLA